MSFEEVRRKAAKQAGPILSKPDTTEFVEARKRTVLAHENDPELQWTATDEKLREACKRLEGQAKEIDSLKVALCPLKGQLREARETALWTIEKAKMQRLIESQAEQLKDKYTISSEDAEHLRKVSSENIDLKVEIKRLKEALKEGE